MNEPDEPSAESLTAAFRRLGITDAEPICHISVQLAEEANLGQLLELVKRYQDDPVLLTHLDLLLTTSLQEGNAEGAVTYAIVQWGGCVYRVTRVGNRLRWRLIKCYA